MTVSTVRLKLELIRDRLLVVSRLIYKRKYITPSTYCFGLTSGGLACNHKSAFAVDSAA